MILYIQCYIHVVQELDDVYHDVAGVVLESLTEGSKKITEKVKINAYCQFSYLNFSLDCKYDR